MTRQTVILLAMYCFVLALGTVAAEAGEPGNTSSVTTGTSSLPPGMAPISGGGSLLTGQVRLACEAKLCLTAIGSAPAECARALAAYHAASMWGGGPAFLAACPVVH